MRKHSLNLSSKIVIYQFLIVIPCFILFFFHHLINISGIMTKNDIIALCILLLVIIFWLYVCRTQFIISKEKYKAIAVNHDERKIILFDRKNQVNILPFENIENINISIGDIVRGIALGQISLFTKSNMLYRVTISKISEFYGEIAKDFSIDIKESIFFNAKSDNQVDSGENNNPIVNNIKTLIIIILVVAGIGARFYKSAHTIDKIKSNAVQSASVSGFDYNYFANDLAKQAKSLAPDDISSQNKAYLVEKVRNNTYIAGEALVKDSEYKFSDEQIIFISQVVAEWTFHKTVDLARSGIPSKYWDDIISKIAFTIYDLGKQLVVKQIPQDQSLHEIEAHVVRVYNQCIEELEQKGLIDKETKKMAESQSNIDAMAKQVQNGN